MGTKRDYDLEFRNLMDGLADDDLVMSVEEYAELGIDVVAMGTAIKARLLDAIEGWNGEELGVPPVAPATTPPGSARAFRRRLVERMRRAEALLPRSAEACRRIYERLKAAQAGSPNPAFAEAFRDRAAATDAGIRQTLVDLYTTGSIAEEDLRDDGES